MSYHRIESSTQSSADAKAQQASGEIWGKAANTSTIPTVKAYRGTLPPNTRGIEFTTNISPTPGTGSPYEANWYPCLTNIIPCSPGVRVIQSSGIDFAIVSVVVTKNTQVP
jgi:hypothetical protein